MAPKDLVLQGYRGKRIMASKRYKKLPEKTKDLSAESIEKLLPELKKNSRKIKKNYLLR